jgi:hypothetical protein
MYKRNYESTGYAPFDQISTANAGYPRPALKGADFADPSYDFTSRTSSTSWQS